MMKTLLDQAIMQFDAALKTLTHGHSNPLRPSPAQDISACNLSPKQQRHVAGLMRINHSGEVCAQALYQGQAMTAKLTDIRYKMEQAANEEIDHLAWCEQRIQQLNSRTSVLNPFWYAGSLVIGAVAGWIGDKWSLGFVVETERQVVAHLDRHLAQIPAQDLKTKAILEQMKEDEAHHATTALDAGGALLPPSIKFLMQQMSKVMTFTCYWL